MVSIIILNFNGRIFLKNCLNSVFEQSYTNFEIIFVDNASNDGSLEFVKENFVSDKLKIFSTSSNLGFAGGNNYGLQYASGNYIVLLNNDTVVEKDWLKYLVEAIESDEKIGIVQSLVYTEGIPMKYYEMNGTINLLGHNIMRIFEIDSNGIGKIMQVSGTSMIVKRELIEKTNGLFLKEYFLYAEDTFLGLKAKFTGYKLLHTSKSVVHHIGSGTTRNQISANIYFYQERNRLLNFLLFFEKSFIRKYILILVFNLKLKFLYCLFTKNYSFKGLLKAYLWLFRNKEWIIKERAKIRKFKIINDNEVLKLITSKITNGENISGKTLNYFMYLYCKLTGIRIMENQN